MKLNIFKLMILLFIYRLGLAGFENPMRDQKTEEVIAKHVGNVSIGGMF